MARLPLPGGDAGNWGEILNEYLLESHDNDGALNSDTVGSAQLKASSVTNTALADGSIQEAKLHSDVQTKLNAPTVIADGSVTNAIVASDAAIDQAKIAGLSTSLSAKVDTTDTRLTNQRIPTDGSVSTAKIADGAVTNAKLASAGQANGIATLDNAGQLLEAQVPSRLSPEELAESIGIEYQDEVATGIAFAVVDDAGRRTELEVGRDGKFTSRVVSSLQSRMSFPTTTLAVPEVAGPNVVLVGHSMLSGAASAITTSLSNVTTTSLSVGGESSRAIAARQGGQPALFTPAGDTFPASGSVDVTLTYADGGTAWPLLQGTSSYVGRVTLPDGTTIAGTFGIIRDPAATQYVHHAGDRYTFTRTSSGSAISVYGGVPFYYDTATQTRSNILVLWIGRNNYTELDQVIGDIQAIIQHQLSHDKRFVVLSEHNYSSATSGTTEWTQIKTLNDRVRQLFGRRYIDTRKYLITSGLAHAGLSATAQDTTDIANDVVPVSLRSDSLHLNTAGSAIIASLIKSRLIELGWY